MMPIAVKDGSHTMTIAPEELSSYAYRGYRPVLIYEMEEYFPSATSYDYQRGQNVLTEPRTAKSHRIIVVKSPESTLAALNDEKIQAVKRAEEASERLAEAEKALKRANEHEEQWKKDFNKAQELIVAERTRANKLYDARNKMESDLAKIRNAIGDLRMKEILESKP